MLSQGVIMKSFFAEGLKMRMGVFAAVAALALRASGAHAASLGLATKSDPLVTADGDAIVLPELPMVLPATLDFLALFRPDSIIVLLGSGRCGDRLPGDHVHR